MKPAQTARLAASLSIALLFAAPAFAQDETSRALPEIDRDNLPMGTATFDLVQNGKINGEWYIHRRLEDGNYVVIDATSLYPDIRETAAIVSDGTTFAPKRLVADGDFKRQIFDVDLTWDGTKGSGSFAVKAANAVEKRVISFEAELPAHAVLRGAVFHLIPAFPLEDGAKFDLTWFNMFRGTTQDVSVIVEGREEVTVPAGTFETFRVKVAGGTPENMVYVSAAEPRRIVRVDVVGQDMRFERRPDTGPN